MELQSWLLYHFVAVSDCNQVMQSAATGGGGLYSASALTMTTSNSKAKDLGLRAQKKLLGKFASSNAGRSLLIDDATTSCLDNLYRLMDRAARSSPQLDKKQPEKVLKNIVKLSIKIGLLHRNQQLTSSDIARIDEVRRALRSTAKTVVSFYELDYSYEQSFMTKSLDRCRATVHELIKPHLTDKSHERCDLVFDFLSHPDFLDAVFSLKSELRPNLGALVVDISKALDCGQL